MTVFAWTRSWFKVSTLFNDDPYRIEVFEPQSPQLDLMFHLLSLKIFVQFSNVNTILYHFCCLLTNCIHYIHYNITCLNSTIYIMYFFYVYTRNLKQKQTLIDLNITALGRTVKSQYKTLSRYITRFYTYYICTSNINP